MKTWKRIEPTNITKVGWRTIVSKTFVQPNGKTYTYDTKDPEGQRFVCVLALTPDHQVIVCHQYRPGPEKMMHDVPGGTVEDDELPELAAKRELLEETSYKAGKLEFLGTLFKEANTNSAWSFYLATDCEFVPGGQHLDETEHIDVKLVSIKKFIELCRTGQVMDSDAAFLAYEQLRAWSTPTKQTIA
jgi:ADP-ribose pyrophosphatase